MGNCTSSGGGGGSSRGTSPTTSNKEPITYKSVKQARDYVKQQVGIDINKYHNSAAKQFEKRGQLTIDISNMSKNERNRLLTALRQKSSPFVGEQSGTWLFTIRKKK